MTPDEFRSLKAGDWFIDNENVKVTVKRVLPDGSIYGECRGVDGFWYASNAMPYKRDN